MKKFLLLLLLGIFAFTAQAQDIDAYSYYNSIENNRSLGLTSDQISRLRKLKREIGPKFAAIGRDRTLMGYEKGIRKRALKQQFRAEIHSILNERQIHSLGNYSDSSEFGEFSSSIPQSSAYYEGYDEIARINAKIDEVEARLDANNDNDYISKYERKSRKAALKAEKKRLKAERNILKNRYRY